MTSSSEVQDLVEWLKFDHPRSERLRDEWLSWDAFDKTKWNNYEAPIMPLVDDLMGLRGDRRDHPFYRTFVSRRIDLILANDHNCNIAFDAPLHEWKHHCPHWWWHLRDKGAHSMLVDELNLPARKVYWQGTRAEDLPQELPDSFYIRMRHSFSGAGHLGVSNGRAVEGGRPISRSGVVDHLHLALKNMVKGITGPSEFRSLGRPTGYLVEELIESPRDIQLFMFGGEAVLVRVCDGHGSYTASSAYRTIDWEPLRLYDDRWKSARNYEIHRPTSLDQMLEAARAVEQFVGVPLRVDFLVGADGRWFFGEPTFNSHGRRYYNYGLERLLGIAWNTLTPEAT